VLKSKQKVSRGKTRPNDSKEKGKNGPTDLKEQGVDTTEQWI